MAWSRANATPITLRGRAADRMHYAGGLTDAIAMGAVEGRARAVLLVGRRTGVSTTPAEAWFGAAEQRPRTDIASPLYASSSSSLDTADGDGARLLAVEYIDADGWERLGVASMTGLTPAPVVQAQVVTTDAGATSIVPLAGPVFASALRVQRAYVLRAGAASSYSDANAGTILVSTTPESMAATAWAVIPYSGRGWNTSPGSSLMVPRGRLGLLFPRGLAGGTDRGENARAIVEVREWGLPSQRLGEFEVRTGLQEVSLAVAARLGPRSELAMLFARDAGGSNVDVYSSIQIVLLDDPAERDPAPELQPPPFG